jgi:glycine cleavage system H protein
VVQEPPTRQSIEQGGSKKNMRFDPECKYHREHEWLRIEGDEGVIGVSDYAQDALSDVVYVELPEVGDTFERDAVFGVVESVKAASDVYMPVSGEILEINEELEDSPELVNEDPYGAAWFVRIAITDPAEVDDLMDAQGYEEYLKTLDD